LTYIVDASVAIKWSVPENLHAEARSLLLDIDRLEAPDLIFPEATNIAWKKCARGEMTREQAVNALRAIRRIIRVIHPSPTLHERALDMAIALNHPAYDCFYLACAEFRGGVVVTADRGFHDVVRATGLSPLVRHLGEFRVT
jgi:predicted nucleic acid-binding protein